MIMDYVHDIQGVYREILTCMSRPGYIGNLKIQAEKMDVDVDMLRGTLLVAITFIDSEVSFFVEGDKQDELEGYIHQMTYGRIEDVVDADYLILSYGGDRVVKEDRLGSVKNGTLIDPQNSATVIVEVDRISGDKDLAMKGPGIENISYMKVDTDIDWISIREEKNIEYPLGIDFILIDKENKVVCIPRTTQILRR